jgi:hypothetical protein
MRRISVVRARRLRRLSIPVGARASTSSAARPTASQDDHHSPAALTVAHLICLRKRACRGQQRVPPHAGARAAKHPRRPYKAVVVGTADQGGAPVARQRHALAEDALSDLAVWPDGGGGELCPLDERVDPQRVARVAVVDPKLKGPVADLHVRGQPTACGIQRAQLPVAQRRGSVEAELVGGRVFRADLFADGRFHVDRPKRVRWGNDGTCRDRGAVDRSGRR